MSKLSIVWKGETVGFMEDPMPDMWYLEGKWLPSAGPKTEGFLRATRNLDINKSVREGSGVWVELVDEVGEPVSALVMAAPAETIFVRRVFSTEAKSRWVRLWHKLTRG